MQWTLDEPVPPLLSTWHPLTFVHTRALLINKDRGYRMLFKSDKTWKTAEMMMTDHRWPLWLAFTLALGLWSSESPWLELSNMVRNMKKFKDMSLILIKSCYSYRGESGKGEIKLTKIHLAFSHTQSAIFFLVFFFHFSIFLSLWLIL